MEMTIDTLIKKIQDCKKVENKHKVVEEGTSIYFTMHDLVQDEELNSKEYAEKKVLVHIPTNTKICIVKDPCDDTAYPSIYLDIPGVPYEMWIGDDLEFLFYEAMSKDGNINAFEFPYRQEEEF